ncbi:MAG: YdeI/OmpD-associated family protein [Bacteroidales bacterium]|nr:YdeI/OmpD-associated family protein [Bacteroidales bacterium]MCF8454924.1 YdeI/OmpD-associated family protein [Bacteroidales bacterium]
MKPIFFADQTEFRKWLEENHLKVTEALVGFYKIGSGKLNMTWSQSVDEALCFGWIDGIRRSVDQESYCIRFTPRKKTSNWSAINISKVEELTKKGLMQKAGIDAFKNRKEEKSKIYSFETDAKKFNAEYESIFKASQKAWDFFISQAPSYQKTMIHWIMSAKQEKTQLSRLEKAISESEKQKRLWDNYKR